MAHSYTVLCDTVLNLITVLPQDHPETQAYLLLICLAQSSFVPNNMSKLGYIPLTAADMTASTRTEDTR